MPVLVPRRTMQGSTAERRAAGRQVRTRVPRRAHAALPEEGARRDAVAVVEASSEGRVRELVPVRHGRMAKTPFTFFRGSAAVMAADLAVTPPTGLHVQLAGDCHLANFGLYATPERNLVFDLNDFDETARGPFEWDVKRLAASAVLAARTNGQSADVARAAALGAARGYRETLRRLAAMGPLTTWYQHVRADDLVDGARLLGDHSRRVVEQMIAKARTHTSSHALPRLTRVVDGSPRFLERPTAARPLEETVDFVRASLASYRRSLSPEIRGLYDRFDVLDIAPRVVGVGSVGLWAWILLLEADGEAVIMQLKEARASVLEPYCGAALQRNAGQRVVVGQRTMQAASDLLLGWLRTPTGEDYYVRQLRDMKGSAPLEEFDAPALGAYAQLCGAVLARAHACSGDAVTLSGYLGRGTAFDDAIARYAVGYADIAERDFERFTAAIHAGRIEAVPDER
jgi:uncharacterized protein (DUF2252 family)